MGEHDRQHRVKLVVDEWGAWYKPGSEVNSTHLLGQQSTMRDAILAGLTLDTFNRHADKVAMAASIRDKQLTLTVTNPHLSEPREREIAVRGARAGRVQAQALSMPDIHAHNTFENPTVVQLRTEQVAVTGGVTTFRFPPASVTRLQIAYD